VRSARRSGAEKGKVAAKSLEKGGREKQRGYDRKVRNRNGKDVPCVYLQFFLKIPYVVVVVM